MDVHAGVSGEVLAHQTQRVLLRLSRVDNQRAVELRRHLHLRREHLPLQLPSLRRTVVRFTRVAHASHTRHTRTHAQNDTYDICFYRTVYFFTSEAVN